MPKILVDVDKDPKKHIWNARYSEKQKQEAVVLYKMIGNLTTVSKHMGIPKETLWAWHNQEWWKAKEEEIRQESRAKLSKNLQGIVDKAFKEIEDRLENGDYIWDQKTGKMIRKPLGGHTVNQILKDSLDKTFFMEKLKREEKVIENEEKITERLLRLSAEFEKFTKMKVIESSISESADGDMNHAIYDERAPGLQEGEPAVQVEARTDSQAGSSEQSPEALSSQGSGT